MWPRNSEPNFQNEHTLINMATVTLHFDTARQAQQLFSNDPQNLRALQDELAVHATSRDGWIRLEGEPTKIEQAKHLFETLQEISSSSSQPLRRQDFLHALQTVKSGGISTLKELNENRVITSLQKSPVIPKTPGQRQYMSAIQNYDITFGIGPAGTGKTFLAMAMAVAALKQGKISKIILTRPAVEAGEALGFLPGDLKEKLAPYLRPLHDALQDMLPIEEIQKSMDRNIIEIAPLAYMRGRTLNSAFVILDEAQNSTTEQMLMFLTRLGFDSKAVITGDPSQVDLPASRQSGLKEALDILHDTQGIMIHKFSKADVVRHPLVQKIIEAYEVRRQPAR